MMLVARHYREDKKVCFAGGSAHPSATCAQDLVMDHDLNSARETQDNDSYPSTMVMGACTKFKTSRTLLEGR